MELVQVTEHGLYKQCSDPVWQEPCPAEVSMTQAFPVQNHMTQMGTKNLKCS